MFAKELERMLPMGIVRDSRHSLRENSEQESQAPLESPLRGDVKTDSSASA